MNEKILTFRAEKETFTEELCHIIELSNSSTDEDVSIAQARLEPGVTTRWHRLKNTIERYYVLSGDGEVDIGDIAAQPVSPGDVVLIPAFCPQRIRNTGNNDLVFLAICSPRFLQENYEDIEQEEDKAPSR
ncbi:MAG: cupin domain-containing protein [Pseudomonadales bacterium]|nr:cupin domain-containing protein [Pseudomonadales bacterium]